MAGLLLKTTPITTSDFGEVEKSQKNDVRIRLRNEFSQSIILRYPLAGREGIINEHSNVIVTSYLHKLRLSKSVETSKLRLIKAFLTYFSH